MQKLQKLWKVEQLRNKLLYTLFILLLFRVGCGLAVPFIRPEVMQSLFNTGNTLDYLNMISGGALSQCAVFALGVSPYINASIIIQLLCNVIPSWEKLKDSGEGQKAFEKYTKILSCVLSLVMSLGYYFILRRQLGLKYTGFFPAVVIVMTFAAGSSMVVWLANRINQKGIGNGVSLIIFTGIVSRWSDLYATAKSLWMKIQAGQWGFLFVGIALVAFFLLSMYYVVYSNGSERRIPISYAKKRVGNKIHGGNSSYIPLKLMMSGVLPVIFASTILSLPQTIVMFMKPEKHPTLYNALLSFGSRNIIWCVLYGLLIFGFTYFYISIQYDPVKMANDLRVNGGMIPGKRPGKPTSDFLAAAMKQMAGTGAFTLVVIALAPIILGNSLGYTVQMSGTSLLIVVGVAEELVNAVDSELVVRHHRGFLN